MTVTYIAISKSDTIFCSQQTFLTTENSVTLKEIS